ncbi:Mitochondrial fission protein [Ciborinia camelliae]|nr:Mitochondrial fission protein [Ciborinia camelliae]
MAGSNSRNSSSFGAEEEDDGALISTRGLEAFGRKVTTTAGHLIGPIDPTSSTHYQNAMSDLHKQLRRPNLQRSVFSFAKTTPTDLVRSKLSTSEIQYRALTFLPDELLRNIPDNDNSYSLFQGFQATLPETTEGQGKKHRRRISRGRKLLDNASEGGSEGDGPPSVAKLKKEKAALNHRLEMMGIRKNMASSEIHGIDNKIANLNSMRRIVLDRLAGLEQEESMLEHENVENRLEDAQEQIDDAEALGKSITGTDEGDEGENPGMDSSFMSESIYEKLPSRASTPSSKGSRRHKTIRRKSMPILHEHFEPGSSIREIQAHDDMITALDFDVPFGTMVSSALDDTIRVWDMNAGRCIGLLEGHTASVRTLQVEDNIVATGSMDATIRLWDLSKARYDPQDKVKEEEEEEEEDDHLAFGEALEREKQPIHIPQGTMEDCPLFTLEAHVDEVTALHFRGDTLISGSADKTLRQWDLEKGRCVQTLDVMWAAAQASVTMGSTEGTWRQTGRSPDATADFVGAVQVFDAALACGTADGMVRLWDLRSGQVHRSLVGHTGPVTCLQFDDVHLVTGSLDRSIRIWDLRTGAIYDAYAYDSPITSMMFDTRRIISAAGEDVVKVYDKTDGRHWDCGVGAEREGSIGEGDEKNIVEKCRVKDGYMVEGRRSGMVGIWSC